MRCVLLAFYEAQVGTDVSEQPISPIFEGQAAEDDAVNT